MSKPSSMPLTPDEAALCLRGWRCLCGYRVGELSEALGHSERYVQEVFGRDMGLPPKRWLRGERMAVAVQLLNNGMRPGEVAARLGFSQGGGFRREFRHSYGMPPMDYMRKAADVSSAAPGGRASWDQAGISKPLR